MFVQFVSCDSIKLQSISVVVNLRSTATVQVYSASVVTDCGGGTIYQRRYNLSAEAQSVSCGGAVEVQSVSGDAICQVRQQWTNTFSPVTAMRLQTGGRSGLAVKTAFCKILLLIMSVLCRDVVDYYSECL